MLVTRSQKWFDRCLLVFVVCVIVGPLVYYGVADGAAPAQGGRVAPHHPCGTLPACHKALAWHRKFERHLLAVKFPARDAEYAIRLASAAFHVSAADMRAVASCESGMGRQTTPEPHSQASGLFQFLPSTWSHTPFSGFDVFDPFPNALAAAQLVLHDGSWRQWTCQP